MKNNSGMLDYFSVIVIGDKPDEIILKYDLTEDTDKPYIIYNYSDVKKIRKERIKFYDEFLKNTNDPKIINGIKEQISNLKSMNDLEYYTYLGEVYSYDIDKNIISTENPNGKWITCEKGGKIFSNYLKDFNDNGIISAKKSEIDWGLINMREEKVNLHSRAWELCVDKIEPENDKDKNIIKNMKMYAPYFKNFKDKGEYIKMGCSFWSYGIVGSDGVWIDMENRSEFDWIINFYDRFIKDLLPDTLITIYECTK